MDLLTLEQSINGYVVPSLIILSSTSRTILTVTQLGEIALGLEYLHGEHIVHGDLHSVRPILLSLNILV